MAFDCLANPVLFGNVKLSPAMDVKRDRACVGFAAKGIGAFMSISEGVNANVLEAGTMCATGIPSSRHRSAVAKVM